MTTTTSFGVTGMTCGHCVSAVTRALSDLSRTVSVDVTLVPGCESRVTVVTEAPLSRDAVDAAVDAAGYEVAWL